MASWHAHGLPRFVAFQQLTLGCWAKLIPYFERLRLEVTGLSLLTVSNTCVTRVDARSSLLRHFRRPSAIRRMVRGFGSGAAREGGWCARAHGARQPFQREVDWRRGP